MLATLVKTIDKTTDVKRAVKRANIQSLSHAGGAIRLTAVRSIRRRKKPSKPGTPPHSPTGKLRRAIRYAVDHVREEVVIGPVSETARTIWHLHEFGGVTTRKLKQLPTVNYQIGDYGPVRVDRYGRVFRTRLRSAEQVAHAVKVAAEANAIRQTLGREPVKYPKRPFMGPALQRIKPTLTNLWSDSVR